jgi:hypothetical protein
VLFARKLVTLTKKDGKATVIVSVVVFGAAVIVVRVSPRHEQADEYAAIEGHGETYFGIAVALDVNCLSSEARP